MWVQSLGREDPLELEIVTHPIILAWRIQWTEKPGGLWSGGHKESDTTKATSHAHTQAPLCWKAFIIVIGFMSSELSESRVLVSMTSWTTFESGVQ